MIRLSLRVQSGRRRTVIILAPLTLGLLLTAAPAGAQTTGSTPAPATPLRLTSTRHPPIPDDPFLMWLAPRPTSGEVPEGVASFTRAVEAYHAGKFAETLTALDSSATPATQLAGYARYYRGLALIGLQRPGEARTTFAELRAGSPDGYLAEAAALAEAEAAEALEDYAGAVALYLPLTQRPTVTPDWLLLRLGRAAQAGGNVAAAADAFRTLRYRYPLRELAAEADRDLERLQDALPLGPDELLEREMARAARLFSARRHRDARAAYLSLRGNASGDDLELIDIRVGVTEFELRNYAAVRERVAPYLTSGSRQAEAQYWDLRARRRQGRHTDYETRTRQLVARFPETAWAEAALDTLGTHYIVEDRDDRAAATFRELFTRYPSGRYGDRAAWKAGWWEYRHDRHRDAAVYFDGAASLHPRSNYRPWFLYWSGRSHEAVGAVDVARDRYRLSVVDYGNSYYGRMAADRLARLPAATGADAVVSGTSTETEVTRASEPPGRALPPTAELIRLLIGIGHHDAALNEIEYATLRWGDSPVLRATRALVHHLRGELRPAINEMKRAYPQYLAAVGERLPREILEVLFPAEYWDLIRKYSEARNLDPYLIAALIGQESTFDPTARSSANAYGLMQVVPSTGRRYARAAGVRYSRRGLIDPETNIRLGTASFSRLIDLLGDVHLALAGYNAGDARVRRWLPERRGLDQDEFIDDIPFPETQNYVKRVLGTAENYRRLYGGTTSTASASAP